MTLQELIQKNEAYRAKKMASKPIKPQVQKKVKENQAKEEKKEEIVEKPSNRAYMVVEPQIVDEANEEEHDEEEIKEKNN